MPSSAKIPEVLKTISDGLEHTLEHDAIVILSHPGRDLYHWNGDSRTAFHLRQWLDTDALIRESAGVRETDGAAIAMPGVAYIVACPVSTPRGPQDFVVAVAGTDRLESDVALALLQALTREATTELMVLTNAPSIHAALDEAPVGMSIASMEGPDMPLVYVNGGFERLTGYTRAEVIGRNCRFLQNRYANDAERGVIRDALATGQGCAVELDNVRKDGKRFINLLKLRPVYTGGTKPTYYIGFQSDITAQRQAERAKESIIDVAPVGILVVDPEGRIRRINQGIERMFGYAKHELIGQPAEILIPERLREAHRDLRDAFHQSPEHRAMGPDRELRAICRDGTEFPVTIGLSSYDQRDETYIVAAINDLSERKQLEESLREKKDEAERAQRAQADFFANVTHELKTPLNAIIGFSSILKAKQAGTRIEAADLDYASNIHESAQHLLGIIEHILSSAKISAGDWTIESEALDVGEIVQHAMRQVETQLREKRLDLNVEIASDLPPVWADERSLRQILINLLSNAVKFTPAGGRIAVGAWFSADDEIRIRVADTGPGMDADEKRRALEAFGQAEDRYTRRAGGTGLGLPIVKALVERHQGRLEIDSAKGRGTTVDVVMPPQRTRSAL